MSPLPITDLHCDLLSYLACYPDASEYSLDHIGASIPHLKTGHVKHQVLAIYAPTKVGSVEMAQKEVEAYQKLIAGDYFHSVTTIDQAAKTLTTEGTGVTVSLENASTLCEETEPLDTAFKRLDEIIDAVGHLFYIGFTHHPENRFGGGNYSDNVGLKDDGKKLLEYMSGRGIAVDFSHASDALAYGIIEHIDHKNLDVPVIASHSNFRTLTDHVRNLPNELVQAIIEKEGLIGMNFLRAYIHESQPDVLIDHILHGFENTPNQVAFGADFFETNSMNQPDRNPYFFPAHENAGKYPGVLNQLQEKGISNINLTKLSSGNALDFIRRNWKK